MGKGKISLIISVGILALSMGGCKSSDSVNKSAGEEQVPQKSQTTTTKKPTTSKNSSTADQDFADPLESGEAKKNIIVSGLIPPTNPEQRAQGVIKGRNDPFSVLLLEPKIETIVEEDPATDGDNSVEVEVEPESKIDASDRSVSTPDEPNSIPTIPPVPQPVVARGVIVTGVIKVNGVVRAIVKAPEELSSRYVEPGQYLSNGQVLVKRIELNNGAKPIVVLQEVGIDEEVIKRVGEQSV